ncbi:MAG: hypothetical protein AAFV53_00240 [Myxococcota bacterium]
MATTELEQVIDAFEARLADGALGLTFINRLVQPRGTPKGLAHQGVWIILGPTTNAGQRRERHDTRMTDTLTVGLSYRINPHGQRESRRGAVALETRVRKHLTHYPWHSAAGVEEVTYAGTTDRRVDAEHYVIVQQFTVSRVGSLGTELDA